MEVYLNDYLVNSSFLVLFLFTVFSAKRVYNFTTPYCTFSQLIEQKNRSLAFSISGYLLAVTIIYLSVLSGPTAGLVTDLMNVAIYSTCGMLLLVLSRVINDKFLLPTFCNTKHLIEKQNLATGFVQAASYISSGLLIGGALSGEGSWLSALVFYALGQCLLVIFAKLYDIITQFDLQSELKNQNLAAGISFSATLIALGIILFHAIAGEFVSWQQSLTLFAIDSVIAFLCLPIFRLAFDKLLLPSISLDKVIAENNVAVALIEGAMVIGIALAILIAL